MSFGYQVLGFGSGGVAAAEGNKEGIFGYGYAITYSNTSNIISDTGVVGSDVTGVGTPRSSIGACEYGGDKGIFGFGTLDPNGTGIVANLTNKVSNLGVCATDTAGVGTARTDMSGQGCSYGTDKGIFAYGSPGTGVNVNMSNLVSNLGAVASDVTGVGTARRDGASCEYGEDKGIFGYGYTTTYVSMTNLVTNLGVVGTDVTGVGSARWYFNACSFGAPYRDQGIFGYGLSSIALSVTNIVSNLGVVGTDVTGVGTARYYVAATQYGGDKGIFGFGSGVGTKTNLVSNLGVVGADIEIVSATRKQALSACSFGTN